MVSRLLKEARAVDVVEHLESAELVLTSELTMIECARAIHRARSRGLISGAQAESLRSQFAAAAAQWDILEIRERVVRLASASFPVEPVRALDAIHLASAMIAREVWPELSVLSFDERVRANALALDIAVLPEAK